MIKRKEYDNITIDLTGPQGNAFVLLGTASKLSKRIGLDSEKILNEMQESDYENLVSVFDKYFGEIVTLLR